MVSLCQFVVSQKINDPILLRYGINSLLVLGREEKAKALLSGCRDSLLSAPNYLSMLDRYLERHSIFSGLEESLQELKNRLLHEFVNSQSSDSFVDELSSFTDIVLVSNGPSLDFSSEDKRCMLAMKRPLFVYFNIGNPILSRSREEFYPDSAAELLMGSYQHVVDQDHRLIFQPLIDHRFLGC